MEMLFTLDKQFSSVIRFLLGTQPVKQGYQNWIVLIGFEFDFCTEKEDLPSKCLPSEDLTI